MDVDKMVNQDSEGCIITKEGSLQFPGIRDHKWTQHVKSFRVSEWQNMLVMPLTLFTPDFPKWFNREIRIRLNQALWISIPLQMISVLFGQNRTISLTSQMQFLLLEILGEYYLPYKIKWNITCKAFNASSTKLISFFFTFIRGVSFPCCISDI